VPGAVDLDIGNGICRYLDRNLCTIYETRPLVCNVEAMYAAYFEETTTWIEFISMNIQSCIEIAKLHKADEIVNRLLALGIHCGQ
jgi:Fe-S-cluster containining protein